MPLQDHIHLGIWGGPDTGAPEFAPQLKYIATERKIIPVVFATIDYTLNARLKAYTYKESGNPIVLRDFAFRLKIQGTDADDSWTKLEELINLMGRMVAFCDHFHPNNGSSHTSSIKQMYLEKVENIEHINPGLHRYDLNIYLKDASRT